MYTAQRGARTHDPEIKEVRHIDMPKAALKSTFVIFKN